MAALAAAVARFVVNIVYRKITEIDISKLENCFLAIEEIQELLSEGDVNRVTLFVAKRKFRVLWWKDRIWHTSAISQFKAKGVVGGMDSENRDSYHDIVVDAHYINIINRLADEQTVFMESSEIKKGGSLLASIYNAINIEYSEIHPLKANKALIYYVSFASPKPNFILKTTKEKIRICKKKLQKVLD
jgi:hypothetical protein